MIERMKKLSLLIYHASRDKFLRGLQEYGAVHLEIGKSIVTDEIMALKDRMSRVQKSQKILKEYEETKTDIVADYSGSVDDLLVKLENNKAEIEALISLNEGLKKDAEVLSIWGEFDPEGISQLESEGIKIKFYAVTKSKFKKLDLKELTYEIVSESKGTIYFVVFYREASELNGFDVVEEKIPLKRYSLISGEIDENIRSIKAKEIQIASYSTYSTILREEYERVEDKLSFALAGASLSEEVDGKVLVINGWIPEKKLEGVKAFLNSEDAAFVISEPVESDNIPILLKNNPFAKLFEPITKIFSLPSYGELDTTPFFAPFFAAFFGLCLADMGYGFILFLTTLAALLLVKNKSAKPLILLGMTLGIATMLGGLALNSFFGAAVPEVLGKFVLFKPSADGQADIYGPMIFSLMLGVLQVSMGFILQSVNKLKTNGFFGLFQPVGNMLFLVGMVIWVFSGKFVSTLGGPDVVIGPIQIGKYVSMLPPSPALFGMITAGVGVVFILLFNSLDKPIYIRPLTGLWAMYNAVTGLLGNILSYVRLFALGLAGGLLGTSFNTIAAMTKDAPGGFIYMGLILLVGHALNFGLGALGSFVHPLRLTFVEFYGSVDFKGGGQPFTPFKNRKK